LTVGGKTLEQPLTVRMDPRVKLSPESLKKHFDLSVNSWFIQLMMRDMQGRIRVAREEIRDRTRQAPDELKKELASFDEKLSALAGSAVGTRQRGAGGGSREASLARLMSEFGALQSVVQSADAEPTRQIEEAFDTNLKTVGKLYAQIEELRTEALPLLNEKLKKAGLQELKFEKQLWP
jgi:hypothetical protein